jgi:uncharacterized membrane protein
MAAKTLTFGIMHMTIAFGVVWLLTGSWIVGGAVALIEPAVNTIGYAVHEHLWARRGTRWRVGPPAGASGRA